MADIAALIRQEAMNQGVDPDFALAIGNTESGFQPGLVSPKGAIGPMQLMPATARDLGVDPTDIQQNIAGGVRYAKQMLDQFGGDKRLAAAAYNAGPTAVRRSLAQTGDIPNYKETQGYVAKVAPMNNGIDPSWLEPVSGQKAASASDAPAPSTYPQAAAGIDPSWLEAPGGDKAAAKAAPVSEADDKNGPSVLERLAAMSANAITPPKGTAGLVDPYKNEAGGTIPAGQWSMSGPLSSLARGVLLPASLIDKYAITPLMRKAGSPDEPTLDEWMAQHTRAPDSTAEAAATKAAGYVGSAIGTGKILRGAGALANVAGLGRIGSFLTNAGAITPGALGGAVTGGAAADVADQTIGKDMTPGGRFALDTAAGALGGWPATALANRMVNGVTDQATRQTLATAAANNVPIKASDLSDTWSALRRISGMVPLGNMAGRSVPEQQVTQVRAALGNAAEKYRPTDLEPTAGQTGTDRYLANDIRNQYQSAKTASDQLYGQLGQTMANSSLPPITTPKTTAAAKQLFDQYPDAFRNLEVDSKSRALLSALGGKAPEAQTVMVGGREMPLSQLPKQIQDAYLAQMPGNAPLTFSQLNDLRSTVGDMVDQAKRGTGIGQSETKLGMLKQIYGNISQDMDSYMAREDVPDTLRQQYQAANDNFKNTVLPFRANDRLNNVRLSQAATGGPDLAAEGLYQHLFGSTKGETSQLALNLLSPNGQKAAAYQAVKDAADKGLSTATEAGLKSAAAQRALNVEGNPALENLANTYPPLQAEADNLRSLLQIGRKAATQVASKGVLTGFQGRHLGAIYAMNELAQKLHPYAGPIGAYAGAIGAPIGLANGINAADTRLARYILSNPGTATQRLLPGAGAAQLGLLQDEEQK